MAKKSSRSRLSDLENKVMAVLWEKGEATADEVRATFEASNPLTDSSIRTILRRLETKGYVAHRSEGRTFIYKSAVASQNVAVDAVRSIIDRFCNGSVENLLVGMLDREVLSPEKLQELAARIAESNQNASDASAKKKPTSQKKK